MAKSDQPGPVSSSRQAFFCAWLIFLIALVLYGFTLAPTVTLVDSGELIVVARFLGVAHPPGFPLWTMLAHVASLMPWGNVAARVNLASAFFAALAAGMLALVVAELSMIASFGTSRSRSPTKKNPRSERRIQSPKSPEENETDPKAQRLLVLAPALGAGLIMTFSRTLWSYATIAEVYTLNTFLILIIFFLIVRWRRWIVADHRRTAVAGAAGRPGIAITAHDSLLYAGAVVFGLALGVHHVTVALTLPGIALLVYRTEGLKFFISKRLLFAAIVSVLAFIAVYTYLPLAASRSPIINWGTPRSLEEIWWHITGRQYQVFFSFSLNEMGGQFVEFCQMALREFGWPWTPIVLFFAVAGLSSVFKKDRATFWFLILVLGADLLYALSYSIAEDKDAYYLPAFIAIAIAAGFGLRWLIQLVVSKALSVQQAYLTVAVSVLLAVVIALIGNWPFNNRRHYFLAHDYVDNLFKTIAPNGLLLTMDWQVASPMLYAQEIEGRRPDVKVVDIKLLHRLWYFDYLKHAYPDMIERSRDQVDAYVADLKAWEHNPQSFASDPSLTRRININFQEMVHALVRNEGQVASVYITEDIPFADRREGELTKWINQTFQLVAQGLVFKLENTPSFHDSPDVELQLRGLIDGASRFEKDDVVTLKILPVYTSMLVNRGRYLASFNQHERAIAAFKKALTIDPNYAVAKQGLQQSTSKLEKPSP